MFIPKIYQNHDAEEIRDFIKYNGFAILVSQLHQKLWATHIPMLLEKNKKGEDVLQGHISKANLQSEIFAEGIEVLAIFNGPHSYVSSSWYNHENVPTWNYIAVHVYGNIKPLEGDKLLAHLTQLTDKYEQKSQNPVSVQRLSPDFLKRELKGLVGFEIEIQDIQAAYKLSQNRNEHDFSNIITNLEQQNDAPSKAVAQSMLNIKK